VRTLIIDPKITSGSGHGHVQLLQFKKETVIDQRVENPFSQSILVQRSPSGHGRVAEEVK
jgi:hypothetical protein